MHAAQPHYRGPKGMDAAFNRVARWLVERGVNLAGAQTLTVTGRKSGTPQTVPVNPMPFEGREYLVSPRGNTQWARNARVNDAAELRRGRRRRSVRLVEVAPVDRAPIIRAYLDKWGWEVKRFLPEGMGTEPDDATLARHVDDLPVFEIR
ncbi:nitroreductase/quinone reductase family protein [Gordonia aquimaris]|uniref:Nitroreductase/quinone reductase family protein n=1 Tax=Gordonia aquimaris TaxID=2984863 RepID=A0A9X3D2L7_9ACTN|nr:nitroreductase/quinone reductase family protein [Gordonia aquimaris]MCX2963894.1 nitroreductase/quinone reductase family protein [Gordonia aquimaris]